MPGNPHPRAASVHAPLRVCTRCRYQPHTDGDAHGPAGSVAHPTQGVDENARFSTPPKPAIPDLWRTFGALTPYMMRTNITDLFMTGTGELWTDGVHGLRREPDWQSDDQTNRQLVARLIARGGRHIDETTPFVDVRLADGIRVHAVLPPVSTGGPLLSVRIPAQTVPTLDDLLVGGSVTAAQREVLLEAVAARKNLLITGAAGSGKTPLLAALLGQAAWSERIIIIEDVAELRVRHPHVVGLQTRQANLEGAGGVDLSRLVREALRMRPDRLVLGECRGAELRDVLGALNTGHDGGAATLHANSLTDVPARLEALGALGGLNDVALARQAVSGIELVIHLERKNSLRRVAGFGRLDRDTSGRLTVIPLTHET